MRLVLTSFLVLLLGAHGLIYCSVRRAFAVNHPGLRLLRALAFGALAASIPVAVFLHRTYGNPVTSTLYMLASFWLGLVIHLILLLVPCWMVYWIGYCAGRRFTLRIPFLAALSLAASASACGFWRAQHPVVTSIEVEIDSLPAAWEGKTVVQLSDLHLGSVHGRGFLRRVVAMVDALEPEAVFITGDLFSGSCSGFRRFQDLLDALRARRGVFFVTGNHEGYLGLEAPLEFLRQTKIRVLDGQCVELGGLQVVGVGFPWFSRAAPSSSPFGAGGCYSSEKPAILLYHTPTDVGESYADRDAQQVRSYFAPEPDFSFAAEQGVDLQLSGHTHGGQMFPFGLLTSAVWNGFDRGLHRFGTFSLYVSSGTGTWGPPVRTASRGEVVAIELTSLRSD